MKEKSIEIPLPIVNPIGQEVSRSGVQMVWNEFVKADQESGNPQSIEMRYLMAILRAVYAGLPEERET